MKFQVMFKTPDVLDEAIREEAAREVDRQFTKAEKELSPEELGHIQRDVYDNLTKFAEKWVKWNEYVTIEFDTEKGTATVVPCGR